MLQVRSMPKMKLNCHGQSNKVRSMTKTKKDNDMIDHIGVISTKYYIEMSRVIR